MIYQIGEHLEFTSDRRLCPCFLTRVNAVLQLAWVKSQWLALLQLSRLVRLERRKRATGPGFGRFINRAGRDEALPGVFYVTGESSLVGWGEDVLVASADIRYG